MRQKLILIDTVSENKSVASMGSIENTFELKVRANDCNMEFSKTPNPSNNVSIPINDPNKLARGYSKTSIQSSAVKDI